MSDDRLARLLAFIAESAAARDTVVSSEAACDACVRLAGASSAGLTLMKGIRYATDKAATLFEELQFTLGEGPSVDAQRSAAPVLVPELGSSRERRRWPMFTPAAVDAGAAAMFMFPLRSGAVRLGVLALHRAEAGPLTAGQVSDVLLVTDIVLSMLLDEMLPPGSRPGRHHSDGVQPGRAEIHQATGMVSVQLGVTVEEALVRLRAHAFAHEQPIADVAREVVARRLRLAPQPEPDQS